MMKRPLCLLLLLCTLLPAAAEPRYPSQAGVTTDIAAVLSHETLEDLRTLDSRLDKADALRLCIVTVDFLDAQPVQDYADALFDRWDLDDDELLLLIAVGEESYAVSTGDNVDRLLASSTLTKLLTTHLAESFLAQRYDEAIALFVPAVVREINKVCGTNVATDGLFTRKSDSLIVNWASSLTQASGDGAASLLTSKDRRTGLSVLKVVAIIAILLVAFGSFGKKGRASRREKPRNKPQYFTKKPGPKKPAPQYFKPRR